MYISCESKARRVFQIRASIRDGIALKTVSSISFSMYSSQVLDTQGEYSIRNSTNKYEMMIEKGDYLYLLKLDRQKRSALFRIIRY